MTSAGCTPGSARQDVRGLGQTPASSTSPADTAFDAWRRLVVYLVQAFDTDEAPPLPEPPTSSRMCRALMRFGPGESPRSVAAQPLAERKPRGRSGRYRVTVCGKSG